jgi:hypothetical protein
MLNTVTNLSLYTSTSINEALELPTSVANKIFESKAFENWKQSKESEAKTQGAVVGRLNEVIKGLGIVAKTIAGRG